jgi:gliding motility-associated-like protein
MIKHLQCSILILFSMFIANVTYAQFPYVESFRGATAPGVVFGGAPSSFLTAAGSSASGGTPIDPVGQGFLRLTNNTQNQKGFVYSKNDFPFYYGLRVEFEYYIYGGNGADGISFFLFDATADPFVIGGFGGSLGYAQYFPFTPGLPSSPGVSKGYLAIGLDEYGNFSNPVEGRQGGIPGLRPGSVTLRGKGNGDATTSDNYKFLTTVRTSDAPYNFDLTGSSPTRASEPTNPSYRRVVMELDPNPAGGYFITVKLKKGGASLSEVTIINRYAYTDAAPASLRYGFASSTGDFTNFHEVRNVDISLLNGGELKQPTANNDASTGCPGTAVTLDIASNDATPNIGGTINKTSIDLDPVTAGFQKTFAITGKGTFTANDNGTVTFTPSESFTGAVETNYTINDTYGKTSTVGKITINYPALSLVANAGTDQSLTLVNTTINTTLSGNNPGAGNSGVWSQISGPNTATLNNNAQFNTGASNLIAGTYTFRWTVTLAGGCKSSDDVVVTVSPAPPLDPAKIGLAKHLQSVVKNTDKSFNITFKFTLVNLGEITINNVSLVDNIAQAFSGATYEIVRLTTTGKLVTNPNFNGNSVTNMLLSSSVLDPRPSKEYVDLEIKVIPGASVNKYENVAIAEGISAKDGTVTRDQSTDGLIPDPTTPGDVTPSDPTPIELNNGDLIIPAGFSPNNDGVNDYFVIENTTGKKLSVEIFNRWGNRVYRSSDYQNNWNGITTEGIHVGDQVPSGTYYYVVIIDKTDKRVGHLTINR